MHIQGSMQIGEAGRRAQKSTARLSGWPYPMVLGNLAGIAMATVVIVTYGALNAAGAAPDEGWVFVLVGAVILSVWMTSSICRTLASRKFRAALNERGLPTEFDYSLELSDSGLISRAGPVETHAPWSAVSDLVLAGPYWVILCQANPIFVPRRFFQTPKEERAFLDRLAESMSDAARARSRAAFEPRPAV